MKKALVVGGANGIGLSIALELAKREDVAIVNIVDKVDIDSVINPKFNFLKFDLTSADFSIFSQFLDVDIVMVTVGFGRLQLFRDVDEKLIVDSFNVNTISIIRLIKFFYNRIDSTSDFYFGVMVSIAGFMSSPFFSVYAATKAALKIFIESVNVELIKSGSVNKLLNVSPGSIKGTRFSGEKNNVSLTSALAEKIIDNLLKKNDLFIPQYEEIYKNVLERYKKDFRAEGLHSYEFKSQSGRI